jgi:hypothetical protein
MFTEGVGWSECPGWYWRVGPPWAWDAVASPSPPWAALRSTPCPTPSTMPPVSTLRVPDPHHILSDPDPASQIDAYRYLLVAFIKLTIPDPRHVRADPDPASHINAYRYRYPDPYLHPAFLIAKLHFYFLMWNNLKIVWKSDQSSCLDDGIFTAGLNDFCFLKKFVRTLCLPFSASPFYRLT